MSFWVFMFRCSDGSYYTAHTNSLECRIAQHVDGAILICYTFNRRPLVVVFSQEFPTRKEALASEQQIKGWGRKKKEAMIRGDWAEVTRLARSSFDRSTSSPRTGFYAITRKVKSLQDKRAINPDPDTSVSVRGEPVEP